MKHITYTTEHKINQLKRIDQWERTNEQNLAISIWDKIFCRNSYYGATLKELEQYLGFKIDNAMQIETYYYTGIHGLEYKTHGNVRYTGTHNLSHVDINDFNAWIKSL
jgi:hypothetical protein